jgi:hypothetical protein
MKTYASVALLLLATNVAGAETSSSRPYAYSTWGAWASSGQQSIFHEDRDRGVVRHDRERGSSREDRDRDDRRPGNGIPRSGTATFNGTLIGTGPTYVAPGAMVDVKGTSTLTANFGNRTMSGVFVGDGMYRNCPVGPCGIAVPQIGYVNLSGTGPISGSGYTFPSLTGTLGGRPLPASPNPVGGVSSGSASGTFGPGARSTTGIINAATTGMHPIAFSGTFSAKR